MKKTLIINSDGMQNLLYSALLHKYSNFPEYSIAIGDWVKSKFKTNEEIIFFKNIIDCDKYLSNMKKPTDYFKTIQSSLLKFCNKKNGELVYYNSILYCATKKEYPNGITTVELVPIL